VSDSEPAELGRICRHASILVGEAMESRWAGLTHLRSDRAASADPVFPSSSPSPSSLEEIAAEVAGCRRCPLHEKRSHTVFGEGDPAADLMFVGEGPGADEDRLGRPFVGRAGRLLDDIIEKGMGLRREQVFIANVVKCRPPENRNPEPVEIASCRAYLHTQIDLIRPKVIVALGKFAAQTLLETKSPISRLRGQFFDYRGIRLMPTFHPSYLLRRSEDKRLAWGDIQQVMRLLNLSPKGSES
jgi:uracil-DNA glycosylase family 4